MSLFNKSYEVIITSYSEDFSISFSLSSAEPEITSVFILGANLAISFSKMEKRVLLIDCDLRRPNVHNIFKLDNKKGLTNVIGKMIEIDEAVKHDVLPNLDILPAGTVAPNPSELMCSTRFQELYEQFVRDYDYVIGNKTMLET